MLLSHTKKFIYLKTVKTAGTSVEAYFEPYCLPPGTPVRGDVRPESVTEFGIVGGRGKNVKKEEGHWWNHMPAKIIKERLDASIWRQYFKFCVIRNPFDKVVSAFFFFDSRNAGDEEPLDTLGPDEIRSRFKKWILRKREGNGLIVNDRNIYTIKKRICADYVIRFEALHDGIKHVCEQVGVPYDPAQLPTLKSGFRKQGMELRDFYDEETSAIVAEQYQFEMDHFGYSRP